MRIYLTKKSIIILLIFLAGVSAGFYFDNFFSRSTQPVTADNLSLDDQEATIRAIEKIAPSVISIIVYDYDEIVTINLGTGEQNIEKKRIQKSSGSGFLISADGLILTNKHVVNAGKDETAEYRIILNSGKQYYAQLIGKDPLKDLAILKIFDKDLPFVELGNSDDLLVGTTVIAIGNALGRYQNSVTKGIVSGLGRSLTASDRTGNAEFLDNVIQTDAEINFGNSGGPLINLTGRVIGINVAIDKEGSAIGFAIPVNDARPVIKSVGEVGRIIRPRLGVQYMMLTAEIALDNKLERNSGAWLVVGVNGSPAVVDNSPAARAGLEEGDIIFEINAIKIENQSSLFSIIQNYKPRDKIGLKIQRGNKVIIRVVELDEFK